MGETVSGVDDFQREVLESDRPVFVKFSAPWCGPCRAMAPMIASMADDYADDVKFVDIDLDQSPDLAATLAVRGVPTFLVFRDGEAVDRAVGAQSRTRIAEMIEAGIEGGTA